MTDIAQVRDELEDLDRVFLGKLLLASDVILKLGEEDGAIPAPLESELWLFRDRVERALLLLGGEDESAT